jgi:hypothetical protein
VEFQGFGLGRRGEIIASGGVDDATGRINDHPLPLSIAASQNRGFKIAALGTDTGDKKRKIGGNFPDLGQLVGVGSACY